MRSRGSRAWAAASSRSVHHGLTRTRSTGLSAGAPGSGRRGGHGGGPVRNGTDARHIAAQVPMNASQSSPEPGDHASSAAIARGRSAESSTLLPSAKA